MQHEAAVTYPNGSFVPRLVDALKRRWPYRVVFELGLVALAFLLYFLVRGAVVSQEQQAFDNAQLIIDWQRALGIYWEPQIQQWVLPHKILVDIFNWIYFWLDFPLIVAVGLWMYFFHRHEYTVARDAILLSGAIALVFYATFPVMPPRLLPTGDFVDTLQTYNQLSYQAQSLDPFVNPYAAVPSLHYGWAVIIGGAIILVFKNPFIRFFGLAIPWLQLASIVATANHYILDAAAGLVVCVAGIALAGAMQKWVYPAVQGFVYRRWGVSIAGQEPSPAGAVATQS